MFYSVLRGKEARWCHGSLVSAGCWSWRLSHSTQDIAWCHQSNPRAYSLTQVQHWYETVWEFLLHLAAGLRPLFWLMSIMFCRGCSAWCYYEARYMNYDTRQIQSGWHLLAATPAACKLQHSADTGPACSTLQSGTGLLPLVLMKTEIQTTQT